MNELRKKEERSKEERKNPSSTTTLAWSSALGGANMTAGMVFNAALRIGMPLQEAEAWIRYMDDVGWCFKNGNPVNARNFRRPLRLWHVMEGQLAEKRLESRRASPAARLEAERQECERRNAIAKADAVRKASLSVEAWTLCAERCANYLPTSLDGKPIPVCGRGVMIPPQMQDRPIPPEQCPRFAAIGGCHD